MFQPLEIFPLMFFSETILTIFLAICTYHYEHSSPQSCHLIDLTIPYQVSGLIHCLC
jgi:hypothetical protein